MTNLNLQKKAVKNIIIKLIIITVSTLLILFPISIILFYKAIERIQNNMSGFRETRLALLPIVLIVLTIEILLLVIWGFRYLTLKKITFPNEEIKTIYCKKISIIKIFSVVVGLKIKTEHKTLIYISSKDNETFDAFKKELLHKTFQLKCYPNTNFIKKLDKKSILLK